MCCGLHMEVRGQVLEVNSLLPCGLWESNSSCSASSKYLDLLNRLPPLHTNFLRQGHSLNLELTNWIGWLANVLQESASSVPTTKITATYPHAHGSNGTQVLRHLMDWVTSPAQGHILLSDHISTQLPILQQASVWKQFSLDLWVFVSEDSHGSKLSLNKFCMLSLVNLLL